MQAVFLDLQSLLRMFRNRCACVTRRFCIKLAAKSHGFRRNFRQKSAQIDAKDAPQVQHKQSNNALIFLAPCRAMQVLLKAMRALCARKLRQISPKSARFSALFAGKSRAFSARNARHDHKTHRHRCRQSVWTFNRSCACFAIDEHA